MLSVLLAFSSQYSLVEAKQSSTWLGLQVGTKASWSLPCHEIWKCYANVPMLRAMEICDAEGSLDPILNSQAPLFCFIPPNSNLKLSTPIPYILGHPPHPPRCDKGNCITTFFFSLKPLSIRKACQNVELHRVVEDGHRQDPQMGGVLMLHGLQA